MPDPFYLGAIVPNDFPPTMRIINLAEMGERLRLQATTVGCSLTRSLLQVWKLT
jgi:hypothetical protein